MSSSVEQARDAFARRAWGAAFSGYVATAEEASVDAADHERMAICAYLVGEDSQCAQAWESAHRAALEAEDRTGAARCAFWLAMCLLLQGHTARAGGWLARAEHLLDESGLDCPTTGYLLIPGLLSALGAGDPLTARDLAVRAVELGDRFGDVDLRAFGILGHGQALIAMGDTVGGTARLDEVMVSVAAGEVGPITSGIVYCAVILECMQLFDLQRAAEWTDALSAWCDAQPDLVPYRGQCLVHRSQLQQAAGAWPAALTSAESACQRLADPPHPALGLAYYQEAELHRLVGAFDEAEIEYRRASRNGHHLMPGLALLQLSRGAADAAVASIRRALQESQHPLERPALLGAAVEIFRATGDLSSARSAAEEMATIADASPSEVLAAMAAQAIGAVLVAEGDPAAGLADLRVATTAWHSLHMPYEAARVGVLRGLACAAMGDQTAAAMEFGNARDTFGEIGAVPDLERLSVLSRRLVEHPVARTPDEGKPSLSAREREVLAHVAAGKTNREVAALLVISQHTVGRHLENIFTKMGVPSRAAAIAFAYEHHLLGAPDNQVR